MGPISRAKIDRQPDPRGMLKGTMHAQRQVGKDGFVFRGTAMSRVDGFSDVVFGFALTLLVVSLEVPRNFSELHENLRGFVPFAISFLFLMMLWRAHFRFFRRFGLHDTRTIALNAALLFVVLFYVYPLKFLFTFLILGEFGSEGDFHRYFANFDQLRELMVLFGVGFAVTYGLLALMNWNAFSLRHQLELTPVEEALTRGYAWELTCVSATGLLSCLVALLLPAHLAGLAGLVYLAIAVYNPLLERTWARRVELIRSAERAAVSAPAEPQPVLPDPPSVTPGVL